MVRKYSKRKKSRIYKKKKYTRKRKKTRKRYKKMRGGAGSTPLVPSPNNYFTESNENNANTDSIEYHNFGDEEIFNLKPQDYPLYSKTHLDLRKCRTEVGQEYTELSLDKLRAGDEGFVYVDDKREYVYKVPFLFDEDPIVQEILGNYPPAEKENPTKFLPTMAEIINALSEYEFQKKDMAIRLMRTKNIQDTFEHSDVQYTIKFPEYKLVYMKLMLEDKESVFKEECQIVRKEYIEGDHPGQDLSNSLLEYLDGIARHYNSQEDASNVKPNNFILTSKNELYFVDP